jgi:hypothetical protein
MRCPGKDCGRELPDGWIACLECLELIHPAIRDRLDWLSRHDRGSPQHVTLVASIVRLLREGVP